MKIWTLKTDSSQIGSIYITSEQEALDYTGLFNHQFYKKKVIGKNWQDTLMYNLPDSDLSKFIFSGQEFWICSEKAKECIAPLLKKNVEFLPLIHRKQAYKKISYPQQLYRRKIYRPILEMIPNEPHYILNILNIKSLDVINLEQSVFKYDDENDTIYRIERLVFKPEKIENAHLFKINYANSYFNLTTFISDELKEVMETNQLSGYTLIDEYENEGGNLVWTSEKQSMNKQD